MALKTRTVNNQSQKHTAAYSDSSDYEIRGVVQPVSKDAAHVYQYICLLESLFLLMFR